MNERFALLLETVKIRDTLTFSLLGTAAVLLFCGWLLHRSVFPKLIKQRLEFIYAAFCLFAWAIWLIVFATMKGMQ